MPPPGSGSYGRGLADWLLRKKRPIEIPFRLAEEGGVVLLPGRGFDAPPPSARASLASLNEADYARIGRTIEAILQEYVAEYRKAQAAPPVAVMPTSRSR